jgi:hypothetical protein
MNIQLLPLREEETIAFKEEMQEAFSRDFKRISQMKKEITSGRFCPTRTFISR